MISLKEALEEIIIWNPFLEDSIYNWYLNLSSFSEYIHPQVELLTKKEVTIPSIKMALSRIALDNQKKKFFRFDTKNFFLRKDMSIINIEKTPQNQALIEKIHTESSKYSQEYLAVIQWMREIDIVYSSKISAFINDIVPKTSIKLHLENLSLIWVYLDKDAIFTPWLFYNFSKRLYFFDINIIEVISTYRELAILVDSNDTKRAFEVFIS